MTAMSKRLTPARLLRIASVTAGSSFLHRTGVLVHGHNSRTEKDASSRTHLV